MYPGCDWQAQAAMVIYEVPHFDSEEAEMEKHSTSSTGSTQWVSSKKFKKVKHEYDILLGCTVHHLQASIILCYGHLSCKTKRF